MRIAALSPAGSRRTGYNQQSHKIQLLCVRCCSVLRRRVSRIFDDVIHQPCLFHRRRVASSTSEAPTTSSLRLGVALIQSLVSFVSKKVTRLLPLGSVVYQPSTKHGTVVWCCAFVVGSALLLFLTAQVCCGPRECRVASIQVETWGTSWEAAGSFCGIHRRNMQ